MLSIFVMYSKDRFKQLEYTVSCLKDMDLYDYCQKTLIIDENANFIPDGWETIQVPRIDGKFVWANMWLAGVLSSKYDKILYLDSDRLLPEKFLSLVFDKVKDNIFVFTSKHFMLLDDSLTLEQCKRFLRENLKAGVFMDEEFLGKMKFDPRHGKPVLGPGKNVMSGGVGFTKKTFLELGGVDPWYSGHGAFADTDFHYHAHLKGCRFVDLNIPEVHCFHGKKEEDSDLDDFTLKRMGLDNFIYFCYKWGLKKILAENLAKNIGVQKPIKYVENKLKEYATG